MRRLAKIKRKDNPKDLTPTQLQFLRGEPITIEPKPFDPDYWEFLKFEHHTQERLWRKFGARFLEKWNRDHPDKPHPNLKKFGMPEEED